ncbi:hypothetical protein AB7828_29475 [Tardiphaga sp. 215_C5_N2_1]|uniref:hypothetical protein n=1 Tax=Tardiphaga sp. 215_C5_N2_1 TaxID=3240774 RepID=UPI003F8B6FE3
MLLESSYLSIRKVSTLAVIGILLLATPASAVADCAQPVPALELQKSVRYQLVLQFVDNQVEMYFNLNRIDFPFNGEPKPHKVYEINDLLVPEGNANTLRVNGYNEGFVGTPHSNPGRIVYSIIRGGKENDVVLSVACDHPDNQSPVRRDMFKHNYNVTFK